MTEKKYIAFFDLDHTILSINSGKVLVINAYKEGFMPVLKFIHAIILSILYKLRLCETSKIVDSMALWLKGIPVEKFDRFCSEMVNKFVIKRIRPEIINEMDRHKKAGAKIVILSSSLPSICIPIKNYLEMDDIICSQLEISEGLYTGKPIGKLCFGNEKRIRMEEYCKKNHYHLNDAFYYADSISDYPALKATGNPICVRPDRKLTKIAKKENWKLLSII